MIAMCVFVFQKNVLTASEKLNHFFPLPFVSVLCVTSTENMDGLERVYLLTIKVLWVYIFDQVSKFSAASAARSHFNQSNKTAEIHKTPSRKAQAHNDALLWCVFLHPNDLRYVLLRYKNKTHDSTMAILDIGLLTGFMYDTDDLNKVKLVMDQRSFHTCKKLRV